MLAPYAIRPPSSTNSLAWYIAGSRCRAASSTMRLRSVKSSGLGNTTRASARLPVIVENALRNRRDCPLPRGQAASFVVFVVRAHQRPLNELADLLGLSRDTVHEDLRSAIRTL